MLKILTSTDMIREFYLTTKCPNKKLNELSIKIGKRFVKIIFYRLLHVNVFQFCWAKKHMVQQFVYLIDEEKKKNINLLKVCL